LGLFRFSGTPVRHLIRALENRLAGIAEPEHVRVQLDNGEYMVKLTKYDFVYHTFKREHDIDPAELHQQEVRRINYLAEEFIADLENPAKILVFRQNEPLLARDLAHLRAAVRQYATNTMLWVLEAQPDHPPGTVQIADDHLMLGYVGWLSPRNAAKNFDNDSWLKVLRAAYTVWRPAGPKDCPLDRPAESAQGVAAQSKTGSSFGGNGIGHAVSGSASAGPDANFAIEPASAGAAPGSEAHAAAFAPATGKAPGTDAAPDALERADAEALAAILTLLDAQRFPEAEALLETAQRQFPAHARFAIEAARTARRRGDRDEALRRWTLVQQRFPNEPEGYSGVAAAHRDAGDFDLADAMLNRGLGRFPDVPWLFTDYGWVAHVRRDWPEAVRRWQLVRWRAPDAPVGYLQGAVASCGLERLEDAQALLQQAAARFPTEPQVAVEQGWLAQAQRDWEPAARHWDAVREMLPHEVAGYTAGARALRELGRTEEAALLLRAAIARFPNRSEPITEYAWLAQLRQDWPAAIERRAAVRAAFPNHAEGYTQAARVLIAQSRHEEAAQVLAEGIARLPDDPEVAADQALFTGRQGR
jgi:tetratricopeptide (TPR) repeat protein